MDPTLRVQPGQQELTTAQEAYAQRFIEARVAAILSCATVDEAEAEAYLSPLYRLAGWEPPTTRWFDSPRTFVLAHVPVDEWHNTAADLGSLVFDTIEGSLPHGVWERLHTSLGDAVWRPVWDRVEASVQEQVQRLVTLGVWLGMTEWHWRDRWGAVGEGALHDHREFLGYNSAKAYYQAKWLAVSHFLHEVFEPNDDLHLSLLNDLVSGHRLGRQEAWLIRKPIRLERDEQGRLHSATRQCVEYADGWGICAWHGVLVPEKVILKPGRLSREDFLSARDVEVRRVIQERMGERFVRELEGTVIDTGPRGILYEARLPEDDPDKVARYVQVQDGSTARQYVLRVPPTVQTAAEAVAWSFQVSVEEYGPAQET